MSAGTRAGARPRRARTAQPLPPGVAARADAARLIEAITERRQPMAAVLEEEAGREGDARDAALVRALVRVTIRRRGDIDWCLGALIDRPLPAKAARVRTVLGLSAAQLLFMRQADHAVVNSAVAVLKGSPQTAGFAGLANAVLRRLGRERAALLERLPVAANTPAWLWTRWQEHYGAEAAAAIAAQHREEPGLDLAFAAARPDPLPEGATALPTGGMRLPATAVERLEGYSEGAWWVQDWAAQLPVSMLGDVAGREVIDLCAAPGGKTMQLAARGARVRAVEVDAARAERLAANLKRTGLGDAVEIVVGNARDVTGRYDAVLLDAPCSSTGTLRRQPDVAWSKSARDVAALARVQQDLLRHAATLLRPGGRLVYATCSLEPEEGEAQVEFVRRAIPSLRLVPASGAAAMFSGPEGWMRTLPHNGIPGGAQGLDGFFAAAFEHDG